MMANVNTCPSQVGGENGRGEVATRGEVGKELRSAAAAIGGCRNIAQFRRRGGGAATVHDAHIL